MSFFSWNKDQQAQWLAQQFRRKIEALRDEHFKSAIYTASVLKRNIIFLLVVARLLKEKELVDEIKHHLLSHTQPLLMNETERSFQQNERAYQNKAETLMNISPWFQNVEFFSWYCLIPRDNDVDPDLFLANVAGQTMYYNNLLQQAICLEAEIMKITPDYSNMDCMIKEIRGTKCHLNSVIRRSLQGDSPRRFTVEVNDNFGHNIFAQLFMGIVGMGISTGAIALCCLFMVPARITNSPYFGTAAFLLDSLNYFYKFTVDTVSSIVFPTSILYALYTTNTCNVVKGDLARELDALEDFCRQKLINNSSISERTPLINTNLDDIEPENRFEL